MKFLAIIFASVTFTFAFPAFAQLPMTSLTYSNDYDNANLPLSSVSCSGLNNLTTTYTNIGALPTFPYVGGAFTVATYNSPACGTCYEITYPKTKKTVYALAVDHAGTGFDLSKQTMDDLTEGHATDYGNIPVTWAQVDPINCGFDTTD